MIRGMKTSSCYPEQTVHYSIPLFALLAAAVFACDDGGSPLEPSAEGLESRLAWAEPITHRALARPLRSDAARVYASTPSGIVAVSPANGELQWVSGTAPGLIGFDYALTEEAVIVNTGAVVSGLDPTNGQVRWERPIPSVVAMTPGPGAVFVTDETTIFALEPATGNELWTASLDDGGHVRLAAAADRVCAERLVSPPDDARVTCFDTDDGSVAWSRLVSSASAMVLTSGRVILAEAGIVAGSGWVGIDADDGDILWEAPDLPENVVSSDGFGEILVGCDDECLAVDPRTGVVLWRSNPIATDQPPGIGDGFVAVVEQVGGGSRLHILSASQGAGLTSVDPPEGHAFCGTPTPIENRVFVFTCSGILHALDLVEL